MCSSHKENFGDDIEITSYCHPNIKTLAMRLWPYLGSETSYMVRLNGEDDIYLVVEAENIRKINV